MRGGFACWKSELLLIWFLPSWCGSGVVSVDRRRGSFFPVFAHIESGIFSKPSGLLGLSLERPLLVIESRGRASLPFENEPNSEFGVLKSSAFLGS